MNWRIGFFRLWMVLALCFWGWSIVEITRETNEERGAPALVLFRAESPIRKACREKLAWMSDAIKLASAQEASQFDEFGIEPKGWTPEILRELAQCAQTEWWITTFLTNARYKPSAWLQPLGALFLGWLCFVVGGWIFRGFRAGDRA